MNIDSDKLRFAMLPSGYKDGTLYSQFPNVSESDFEVVRNSIGTRVNKDGLIEVMDANVPRLDYSDGGCPKLLTEKTSNQLLPFSENFDNWTLGRVTIQGGFSSPSGGNNAYKITATSDNNSHQIEQNFANSVGFSSTYSAFLKKGNSRYAVVRSDSQSAHTIIDFDNEYIYSYGGDNIAQEIIKLNNGWFRISCSFISSNATSRYRIGVCNNNGDFNYVGSGEYVYAWGGQFENSQQLTSYIPTDGVANTFRQADEVTNAGDSSTFNSQSGVLFADVKALADDGVSKRISINDGGTQNSIWIRYENGIIVSFRTSSVNSAFLQIDYDVLIQNKIGFSYKSQSFKCYVNGVGFEVPVVGSGNTLAQGTLSQLDLYEASVSFKGKTKSIQHYDYLSDLEMEQLTGYDSYSAMTEQFNFNVL